MNVRITMLKEKLTEYVKYSDTNFEPLSNEDDKLFIENLINIQTYVIIPNYDNNKNKITHFYTVGLWYFHDIPEIVLNIDDFEDTSENMEIINMIFNILHKNNAQTKDDKLFIEKYKLTFNFTKIEVDDYLSIKCHFMMWFYMYYNYTNKINDILKINMTMNEFNNIKKNLLIFINDDNYSSDSSIDNDV